MGDWLLSLGDRLIVAHARSAACAVVEMSGESGLMIQPLLIEWLQSSRWDEAHFPHDFRPFVPGPKGRTPKGLEDSAQGFNPDLCTHLGRTVETWKTSSMVRTEHRLEAYATLAFRTVERSPRAIPGALAVHPR